MMEIRMQNLFKLIILILIVLGIFYFKSPKKNSLQDEKDFIRVAEELGQALLENRFEDAYAMTSKILRAKKPLEDFRNDYLKAQQKYGEALKMKAGVGSIGKEILSGDGWGFPKDIPETDREAWMHVTFVTQVDVPTGEITRCYDCWLLIIHEDGAHKIAHYQYVPCD